MIISFNTGKVETKGGTGLLQQKRVEITNNGLDVVVPDAGYDGLSTVYVKTDVAEGGGSSFKDFTAIGYDYDETINANAIIDIDVQYSKELYDAWNPENTVVSYSGDTKLVYAPAIDTSNVTDMSYMYRGCTNLKYFPKLNTSKVGYMTGMFNNATNLGTIDISVFDTSSVMNISGLFYQTKISDADLSKNNWNKLSVCDYLFYSCKQLQTVNVTNLLANGKCMNLSSFFCGCNKLQSIIGLDTWDVSNVTDFYETFYECSTLSEESLLQVENWNVTKPNRFSSTFYNCKSLQELDLSNWKTDTLTIISSPFSYCTNLKKLNISSWDLSNLTQTFSLGSTINNLTDLIFGYGLKRTASFSSYSKLTVDSLLSIIAGLYDFASAGETPNSSQGKLTFGSTNLAKLTDEQKSIATNKGWTLS